jgi:hypothetical protein
MWMNLFLSLLLAHLMADFVLQTRKGCKDKVDRKWRSPYHYWHTVIVFALSWLVAWNMQFWWCALVIGITHFAIDMWKSHREEDVVWFSVDQILHILILGCVALLWSKTYDWSISFGLAPKTIAIAVASLVCWKPANIFIKLMLKHYSVNMPEDDVKTGFNAGALIGNLERWLILAFVLMQHYEALGLLIAAKSIIRFGDAQTRKSEYVLAGTLLSIFIAVLAGLMVSVASA